MALTTSEKEYLRDLAKQVAEIASNPAQKKKCEMWKRHNSLHQDRPMVLAFPEGGWIEIISPEALRIQDPFWNPNPVNGFNGWCRSYEFILRSLIYRWQYICDDYPIEPTIYVPLRVENSGWGLDVQTVESSMERGTDTFDSSIESPHDLQKLHFPDIKIDIKGTEEDVDRVKEVLRDILDVRIDSRSVFWFGVCSVIGALALRRGMEQIMIDMIERPEWVHEAMSFFTAGHEHMLNFIEENVSLAFLNGSPCAAAYIWGSGSHYTASGGLDYTTELPAEGYQGRLRLRDLWGFAEAQEVPSISPKMFEEFVLPYQARLLRRFGLNCYGCCESQNGRLRLIKQLPRIRRISVSPWTNIEEAAEELENRFIFSWKPNPNQLVGNFNPDRCRDIIRETLTVARECKVEMIMKDTHTFDNQPQRLTEWVRIALEEAEKAA